MTRLFTYLRQPDRLFAIAVIVLCAVLYAVTGTMQAPVTPGEISASTFPLLTLLAIALICIFILVSPVQGEAKPSGSWKGVPAIILTTAYIALIEPMGFFVVTPLFLIAQPLLENFRRYVMLVISTALITLSVYWLFVDVLAIPLPAGLLGE